MKTATTTTNTYSTNNAGATTKTMNGMLFVLHADDNGGLYWLCEAKGATHPLSVADQMELEKLDLIFPSQDNGKAWEDKQEDYIYHSYDGEAIKSGDDAYEFSGDCW